MKFLVHKVNVSGRVQGVGFRRLVQKHAFKYELGGWVKNNMNGTVTIYAAGPEDSVRTFYDEVSKGSFLARVDEYEILESYKTDDSPDKTFQIKF
jgi:acylphosphatase